jgi:hypothetical protein
VYGKLGYRCNLVCSKCGSLGAKATDFSLVDKNKSRRYIKSNAKRNSYGKQKLVRDFFIPLYSVFSLQVGLRKSINILRRGRNPVIVVGHNRPKGGTLNYSSAYKDQLRYLRVDEG